MRTFGPVASPELQAQIRQAAAALFAAVPTKRAVLGEAYAMEQANQVVLHEVDLKLTDGQRLRVAVTEDSARPPFEWLMEITSDMGEADYFKHYLVREHDIMWAQRKELVPIDEPEACLILTDLAAARAAFEAGHLKATRKKRS